MPVLRPELTPDIPAVDVPLVDTSGRLNDEWRRFLELLLLKTGRGYDQPFISAVQAEENLAAIQELTERLDVLESRATEDPIPADQIEDLRAQIADLRAAVTNADQSDLEDLRAEVQRLISVADDGAAGVQGAREEAQTLAEQLRGALEEADLIRTGGSGALADLDTVTRRFIEDDTKTGELSGNLSVTSTSFKVIAKVTFANVSGATTIGVFNTAVTFQTPAADDASTTGQWAVGISDTSYAENDTFSEPNVSGWTSDQTFTVVGPNVVGSDESGDVYGDKAPVMVTPARLSSATTNVYLLFKITGGSGGTPTANIATASFEVVAR